MKLATYTDLIRTLPVRSLIFRSKRETWEKALKTKALPNDLEEIFDKGDQVPISRQDIFDEAAKTVPNLKKVVYLTILWGYPTGWNIRVHFPSIVGQMPKLTQILEKARECDIPDWTDHFRVISSLPGLKLSTYSKLLYFLGVKVESYDALILDQRLLAVFENKVFDDFLELAHLKYGKASHYVCYLRKIDAVAQSLAVPKENVEMFLFTFGSQLKANER